MRFLYFLVITLLWVGCNSEPAPAPVSEESKTAVKPIPSLSPSPSPSPQSSPPLEPIPTVVPTVTPTPTPTPVIKIPTLETNFDGTLDELFFGYVLNEGGSVQFKVKDFLADDDWIVKMMLPAGLSKPGPGGSSQLESFSKAFHYGTYAARFKPGSCASTQEGVVSAFFTYYNDGKDYNGNGMVDNSEIDIEILCAEPTVVYLTLWTDYSDDENFRKTTRKINFATGEIKQTTLGQEGQWGLNTKLKSSSLLLPGLNLFSNYRLLGFTWTASSVRFFLNHQGKEIELWNYKNSKNIPQHPAYMMFNVWHNAYHWHNDEPAASPAKNVLMNVDWFQYFHNVQ